MDINFAEDGDLKELSTEEAWETIENFAQGQKKWDKPFKAIPEQELAILRAQANELFTNKKVSFEIPMCIAWDKVDNLSPQRTSMEIEPLDQTKLENVGLNNHRIPISYKEVPIFDELEPQPQPLRNCPSLDVTLGEERGAKPTIKPHILDSIRMKVVDNLTIHIPPLSHVASFHPKDIYCYYHPCVDDHKKHHGFKQALLGQGGSLGVDLLNWKVIENNFLRGLSLPMKPKELKNGRKAHLLGDKQILSVGVFDEHLEDILEEIHVTWVLFWKKRDKLATLHNEGSKNCLQKVETVSGLLGTPSG
ncbi:hypothetical protein Tco_0707918 [Tanacetum coccineum]